MAAADENVVAVDATQTREGTQQRVLNETLNLK